jgi:hypothetical protein
MREKRRGRKTGWNSDAECECKRMKGKKKREKEDGIVMERG